ncbi:MAG: ubiquinone/menaquinone biosynthesis methyltransferase [Planctomycetota bacterium]
MPDPRQVRSMFARISARYDLVNRLLSLGIDRSWRAAMLRTAGEVDGRVAVDFCCGTGDVSFLLARHGASVVGVDFTREMIDQAERRRLRGSASRSARVLFAVGDAVQVPLRTGSAALATIAFGIRNIDDRAAALREFARVLEPGGLLVVLEFGRPSSRALASAYELYFHKVLPRIGALVSGDGEAYAYLPRSVSTWPGPAAFQQEIESAGFVACGFRPLSGGIAFLHWGRTAGGR